MLAIVLTVVAVAGKLACGAVVTGDTSRLAVGFGMVPRGEVGLIFASIGATRFVGGEPLLQLPVFSALVAMGLTVGPAVGVPLGTFIGGAFDWRTAFLADAALGAIAFAAVFAGAKRGFVPPAIPLRQRLAPLGQAAVVNALLVTVCWVAGAYTLYTFLAPYMAEFGVTGAAFAGVLALFGAGAFAGNLMGGWASDRLGASRVLVIGIGGLGLALAGLAVAPSLPYALPIALVLLAVWAVLGFLGLPARQSQLIALAPPAAPLLLALNMSAMYLGVAAGATLGGLTMAQGGPAELGYAGAAVELLALLFLAAERRATLGARRAVAAAE